MFLFLVDISFFSYRSSFLIFTCRFSTHISLSFHYVRSFVHSIVHSIIFFSNHSISFDFISFHFVLFRFVSFNFISSFHSCIHVLMFSYFHAFFRWCVPVFHCISCHFTSENFVSFRFIHAFFACH
jgi:hypothetical protein